MCGRRAKESSSLAERLINLANDPRPDSNCPAMTTEEKASPSTKRPIILSPWLVIVGALLLYGITLHHWVTYGNLPLVSRITGVGLASFAVVMAREPGHSAISCFDMPIRLLPAGWQPVALNAFAAVCAALTLGILAASVRLLPHDRTREQRQREGGEFSLLSLRSAFLPALFRRPHDRLYN